MAKKSKGCHWKRSKSLEEEIVSLDVLREYSVASDFEKLVYANLPDGDGLNLVKTKSYKVKDLDEVKQIDDLKKEMLDKVPTNAGTFSWTDTHKFEKKYQRCTGFDFDLYLRCSEPIEPPSASPINVGQILGPAGDNIELIQTNKTEAQFRATPITHKTLLWMEVCTDPFYARHKLYQLLRASIVLRPSDDEKVIGIICLNGNLDYVKMVATALRQNAFVTRRAKHCKMELALAWTKHRNLYVSMNEVSKGLCDLKGTVATLQEDVSSMRGDISSLHEDFSTMRGDMSTLQENMEKKLDGLEQRLEQRLEEILNQLLNGGTTIVAIIITFTTMATIIMFHLWEAMEPKFWMV